MSTVVRFSPSWRNAIHHNGVHFGALIILLSFYFVETSQRVVMYQHGGGRRQGDEKYTEQPAPKYLLTLGLGRVPPGGPPWGVGFGEAPKVLEGFAFVSFWEPF